MAHKVFISFKTEDEDYIMRQVRKRNLSDSTVTIIIKGTHSSEEMGEEKQIFIKQELQASLYVGEENSCNGILGIVLPDMYDNVYKGSYSCPKYRNNHNQVLINDSAVIKEFSRNYYIKLLPEGKCGWSADDRYCVLVKWDDFIKDAGSAKKIH